VNGNLNTQNIIGTNPNATTISANKSLTFEQNGDVYGTCRMTLQNRDGVNGAVFETVNPTVALVDFAFKTGLANTSLNQRNIRLEARSGETRCGVPEFSFGGNLYVGDTYSYTPRPLVVGTQATNNIVPANTLTVNGTLACSGRMTGKMFFCAGKVNADGTKAFTSSSGWIDFTCSVSSNTYTITFNSSHPAGSNYVIQVTGQGAIANVSGSVLPSATGFRVVVYSTISSWPTAATAPFFFSVTH